MKYGGNVRRIASEGGNFNWFDVTFRKWRQTVLLPWDRLIHELYLRSFKNKFKGQPQNYDRSFQSSSGCCSQSSYGTYPPGYCFRFHGKQYCNVQCGYKHKCSRCSGNHPIHKCWQREEGGVEVTGKTTPDQASPAGVDIPIRMLTGSNHNLKQVAEVEDRPQEGTITPIDKQQLEQLLVGYD